MATKMTKTKQAETEETKEISNPITVDADALIKSILNNTNQNNINESHSKEYIMCRSVTSGGLNINCKSGNVYEFKDYGTDCEIEYHDLVALVRKHSDHIFEPRIVIEDESFVEEFPQLSKAYETLYTKQDLDTILNLPVPQMVEQINSMPKSVFENLKNIVANKIANGSIDSVKRIRALSEIYNSDFNLLSELFSN